MLFSAFCVCCDAGLLLPSKPLLSHAVMTLQTLVCSGSSSEKQAQTWHLSVSLFALGELPERVGFTCRNMTVCLCLARSSYVGSELFFVTCLIKIVPASVLICVFVCCDAGLLLPSKPLLSHAVMTLQTLVCNGSSSEKQAQTWHLSVSLFALGELPERVGFTCRNMTVCLCLARSSYVGSELLFVTCLIKIAPASVLICIFCLLRCGLASFIKTAPQPCGDDITNPCL